MWPFSKHKKMPAPSLDLDRYGFEWANGEALFDAQCKLGHTEIEPGKGIVALVLDAQKHFGTATAVKSQPDGRQLAVLRIASSDGGFIAPAMTVSAGGEPLKPGDAVLWVPFRHVPDVAKAAGDARSGWVGHIVAKVSLRQPAVPGPLQLAFRYDG